LPDQGTVAADGVVGAMPQEAASMANPPATFDQLANDPAGRARAAVGGAAAAAAQPAPEEPRRRAHPPRGDRLHRSPRFEPPPELDFEFTPPTSQKIPNSNLPLTIGLLFSIVASFVIFFVSLAASDSATDPIMPAFWRGLGALAVLMTLSFAASWFMPTPEDHRQLLDQLDAQDRALGRYQSPKSSTPRQQPMADFSDVPDYEEDVDLDKGMSVDVTVHDDDFGEEDELAMAQPEDEDYFEDEDDDLVATSPNTMAGADASAFGAGQ
jgi:hypothetical protein